MVCTVCRGRQFVPEDYTMDAERAPAFKCTKCGTLNLDEYAVHSERDRSSVRLAIAARAAVIPLEDGAELPGLLDPQTLPDRASWTVPPGPR